jgi:hypothetical protein
MQPALRIHSFLTGFQFQSCPLYSIKSKFPFSRTEMTSFSKSVVKMSTFKNSVNFKADGSAPHGVLSKHILISWHRPLSQMSEVLRPNLR